MKKIGIIFIHLLWLFSISPAFAVKVNSLYVAKIGVTTQSQEEQQKAESQALRQVLIKVTGDSHIIDNPTLKTALTVSEKWIQAFGFIAPHNTPTPYLLEIEFDRNGVNHLLRSAAIPIWGENRPLIVTWILAENKDHPPTLLSADHFSLLFKQQADRYGLPIQLPCMDSIDQTQISQNDIIQMDSIKLVKASKRYRSNSILIGHIVQTPAGLHSTWQLIADKSQWHFTLTAKTDSEIAENIVDQVTYALSHHYAVLTSNDIQKNILLKVLGINEHADFTQLVRYLHHLTPVVNVGIVRITGNEVLLSLSLRSTQQSFMQAIALGSKLTPITNALEPAQLVYQWNN